MCHKKKEQQRLLLNKFTKAAGSEEGESVVVVENLFNFTTFEAQWLSYNLLLSPKIFIQNC